VAPVERSTVVMILDRHGEPMAWISERVEVTPIGATYSVLQHPTGGKTFAHIEGVPLDEAEFIYRALTTPPRRSK
jgi:hypothetical protein